MRRQRTYSWIFKYIPETNTRLQFSNDADCFEGVAAEIEEILRYTYLSYPQHFRPDACQLGFTFVLGQHLGLRFSQRCRQCPSVKLAVGRQRESGQMYAGRGDHIVWQ